MPNREELYFTPQINKPHQKWSVLEDPERPGRRLLRRHYRQPGEKPDVRTSFGFSELSPVLEHYAELNGLHYGRISLGSSAEAFELALSIVQSGLGIEIEGQSWYPVIPIVRDNGFSAVLLDRLIPYEEACRLFGFEIPQAKPSIPKRIKRHLARGRTALFGREAEVRQLNQYDSVHRVILADGVTSFETAVYDPGLRWPEAWTSGAALASRRGGALLTGHPVQIGDLIQITGALPTGQIKAHCLVWDVAYDLVVFDIKKELRAWNGEAYFSVLNELHGSPANLDVQTASNLDLAKVRDQKLIQYLSQEFACDVFEMMRDDERVKEEIGFYSPDGWVDEDGTLIMNENHWKLWRMYAAGLPAMQFRHCRDAFYRTQMESPQNSDPDRFRIRFREPKDLMTVKPQELAGAGVRKYIFPEPFVFDRQGYPHWERSTLPDVNSVYLGGFEGEFISLRNPNASHKESGKLCGRRLQQFADIDRGAVMFVHLGFAASPEGTPGLGKSFNGADFDDSVLALLDPEIVAHWKTLRDYPQAVATPTQAMVIDDGDALFDRHPEIDRYDSEFVIKMIREAMYGQMGIGCVVNAIVWFNLLWLNRESIVAQLRAMEPSTKVLEAIRWMELDLPKSQMPMIASRLEEIIDSIKMNGKSVEWANAAITEFRNTCPVAPKFWWQGGFQGEGRIPWHRRGKYNEPIAVTTAMDVAREEWVELFKKARKFADKESWKRCWRVPLEIRTFPTRPEAATAARDFWLLYNRTREAKKAEFLKAGEDHRNKRVANEQEAGLAAYLFAEEDVHNRIKASGMYLEIYAELVKLIFDRELTLEPPRNPDGSVKPVADGILGGPHTLDGFLDMARAAGVTRKYVPITWESDRVRADYGHLNLDVIVEDTLVRMVGSTPNPASWLGIVDVPDGQYRLEHGLLATEDDGEPAPQAATVALPAVNGFEQRLKDITLKQQDRQRIEAELRLFQSQIGQRVTVKPVTYHNPKTRQDEPAAQVFLEGKSEPLCWISREHLSGVTRELTGILVSNGKYSLTAICTLPN
jgi:hypothetical protein